MSQHENEGRSEIGQALKPFEKLMWEVEGYILDKYQSPRPTSEARTDAIAYASTMVVWQKIEAIVNREDEYTDIANSLSMQWRSAIVTARRGNWSRMKDVLEQSARSVEQSARVRKELWNQDAGVVFGDEQNPAVSFLNLKNSL
jgi:hypothetical protein